MVSICSWNWQDLNQNENSKYKKKTLLAVILHIKLNYTAWCVIKAGPFLWKPSAHHIMWMCWYIWPRIWLRRLAWDLKALGTKPAWHPLCWEKLGWESRLWIRAGSVCVCENVWVCVCVTVCGGIRIWPLLELLLLACNFGDQGI